MWIRSTASVQVYLPKRSVHTESWFDTRSVWLFENSLIPPPSQTKKHISRYVLCCSGWIRLIAQGCTCANCPSVSTERWFGAHSARRFEKPPIHPAPQRKTALISADFRGGEGWIRTTEVTDNRFTVCSLWPLGNLSVWSW